jgi:hypothetical protein
MYNVGVKLNFSDSHDYYASAFRYLFKTDNDVYLSEGHTPLDSISSPRTKGCNRANKRRIAAAKSSQASSNGKNVKKRDLGKDNPKTQTNRKLNAIDVAAYIVKNKIDTKLQLYAKSNERMAEGECDLANFMFTRTEKSLSELIMKAWTMHNAQKIITEMSITRMERLENALEVGTCAVADCIWLKCALEVLELNKIDRRVFGDAVMSLMRHGRSKFRNLMLVGRSNTAKTFMLKPLTKIYKDKIFENPSMDKYGWKGIENAQVALLQDFRYSKDLIPWGNFLLLLEGEKVSLPTAKNHTADDIHITSENDIPFFATARGKIEYSRFSADYEHETQMMDSRWNVIRFRHEFPQSEQISMQPCPHCFVKLISDQ